MRPVGYTFGFIFIAGIIGQVSLSTSLRFLPAHMSIDHPSKAWRLFYRSMALFMCNFWSFVFTAALLGALPVEDLLQPIRDGSELAQAVAVALIPLPLLPVVYTLYSKFARWMARRENARLKFIQAEAARG